jgi:Uma2 family endonuclease
MSTSPALLSIDEYLRTSYHPDADYVDGEIEERNLGEYEHGRLQGMIGALFSTKEEAWGIDTVLAQRIRVRSTRVRVADVAILRADAPYEPVTVTPPLLCVEVLSPEDRLPRAKLVLADYLAMGVENIWLIDPLRRGAFTFDADGLHIADPANLSVPGTPIRVDLTEAFERLDKKAAQGRG